MKHIGYDYYEAPVHSTDNCPKYLTVAQNNMNSLNMNVAILNNRSVITLIAMLCPLKLTRVDIHG
jgi:hypothetical protein